MPPTWRLLLVDRQRGPYVLWLVVSGGGCWMGRWAPLVEGLCGPAWYLKDKVAAYEAALRVLWQSKPGFLFHE